jgi:hypothetical protein
MQGLQVSLANDTSLLELGIDSCLNDSLHPLILGSIGRHLGLSWGLAALSLLNSTVTKCCVIRSWCITCAKIGVNIIQGQSCI